MRVGAILAAAAGMVMSAVMPAWSATVPNSVAASPATAPGVSINATSNFSPVGHDVYVSYLDGGDGQALISGQVTHARAGEIIRLYAQSFPSTRRGAREQQQSLATGGTVPYTFEVKPRIATRYTVRLFRRRGAAQPLAQSGTRAIYVVDGGHTGRPQNCSRPVCRQHITVTISLPATAVRHEEAKPWFVYLGVRLGHAGGASPKAPRFLVLQHSATVSAPKAVSRNSYQVTLGFSFRIGNDRFAWRWTACTQDTESADGTGLPGHHGCGAGKISANFRYLG